MSENNQDNNPEIIETEIIESSELSDEVVERAPIVVKKGSFISFVSFLLAASALTVSAYLYMQLQNRNEQPGDKVWQGLIANAEKSSELKFKQLSNQIIQIQKTNTELQQQLKTIESIAANIKPLANNENIEKYDDSLLVQQLQSLEAQMVSQDKTINQIQRKVGDDKKTQNQAIQQLTQKLNNPQPQTDSLMRVNRNYRYEMAEYFLQATHRHLNINSNVEKGLEFLNKTLEQMATLEGAEYRELALELQKVSDQLIKNPPIDIPNVNKQIDQLASTSAKLSFNQSTKTESENQEVQQSSWYDKLIVIRKVDAKNDAKLTSAEQEKVFQDLGNHFSMMKIALMSNKQTLWMEEIASIDSLLEEYFSSQSNYIKEQLTGLNALDINPTLPDLTDYLESIQALNNNEFTPLETKLMVKPMTDTNENN